MKTEHKAHERLATDLAAQRDEAKRELDAARLHTARAIKERDQARGELKRLLQDLLDSLNGRRVTPAEEPTEKVHEEELRLIRVRLLRFSVPEVGTVPNPTLMQVENLIERNQKERDAHKALTERLKQLPLKIKQQLPVELRDLINAQLPYMKRP